MEKIELINPYSIVRTFIVTSFKIELINIILFKSATFRILLYNDVDDLLEVSTITLEEENYLNWNNDDQYVIDYIKTQLNIL
jgi:hypothetical protein